MLAVSKTHSRRPSTLFGWAIISAVVAIIVAPVGVLAWSLVDPSTDVWIELWRTRLPRMILETSLLLFLVVSGAVVAGVGLAWIVSAYRFPARRLVGWLLVTPMAIPAYVGGFVWLETLSGVFGARTVRSIWLCALVMVMSLYPYVYLLARAAFAHLGAGVVDAGRTMGAGPWTLLMRIGVPAARPAIAAGAALVAMEVLTDIGTVRLFNVSTLADGVMRVWFGGGDRDAASELASALTGVALLLIAFERLSRRGSRHSRVTVGAVMSPRATSTMGATTALLTCMSVLAVTVLLPLGRLGVWAADSVRAGNAATVSGGVGHHIANSLLLATISAALCLGIGTLLALAVTHRGRFARSLGRLAGVGYAMPGPVVAVGVVITLAAIDGWTWVPGEFLLVGSTVGLVFALVVRFLAIGYQGVESELERVPAAAVESARVLGAGPLRVALAVELPAVRFGLLAAVALLYVDMIKELPITLLLRPFGVDTLSVWVWQATSESLWAQAAVPSLVIVVIGMLAVVALLAALERGAEVVS